MKQNADGTLDHLKAHLVTKGFHHCIRQDYEETYSTVIKATIIQTLLLIVVDRNWKLHHLDVCITFLNGQLNQCVYREKPVGYFDVRFPNYV